MRMRFGGREATLLSPLAWPPPSRSRSHRPSFATTDNLLTVLAQQRRVAAGRSRDDLAAGHGRHRRVGRRRHGARGHGRRTCASGRLAGAAGRSCSGLSSGLSWAPSRPRSWCSGACRPIVGTLGLLGVYRAAVFLVLGGSWLSGLPGDLTVLLGAKPLGVPVALLVVAAVYAVAGSRCGACRSACTFSAIGNAEERARLSGVAVLRTRFVTFLVSGCLCGVAAAFYVATYRNVATTVGGTLALEAIAAVVLGGTSVRAAAAACSARVLGVLLLRLVQNGLLLSGVPSLWQPVVTGGLAARRPRLRGGAGAACLARFGLATGSRN